MQHIIEIQNIEKKYTISHVNKPYLTIQESIKGLFSRNESSEDFYALNGVSFNVQPGESLGIIGKNGAGKSTLLKILSRITPPSRGKIICRGRLASLLEVGTGFHPELTGRENIYLNGSILGLKRVEIDKKFDEIVDFSGVEKFLDTPLKHYSSGMQLRLAFAVAAHLEPEILVIDEVLAVGDAEFQNKCMGKMDEVSRSGRTVLFVSHNMAAIKKLCSKTIVLKKGTVAFHGNTNDAIATYLDENSSLNASGEIPVEALTFQSDFAKIKKVFLQNKAAAGSSEILYLTPLHFRISLEVMKEVEEALLDIKLISRDGIVITYSVNTFDGSMPIKLNEGVHEFDVEVENHLHPGAYCITVGVHNPDGKTLSYAENICNFNVLRFGEKENEYKYNWMHGYVKASSKWIKLN